MKQKITIIGGGAAALTFASFIDSEKFDISLYEKNKALGRKFLVAGKGGFNLTHSEPINDLVSRYSPNWVLEEALNSFSNVDFRVWLASIGVPTFVGSSHRVYPEKGIKPIEVLKAIEKTLAHNRVQVNFNKTWTGWNDKNDLVFSDETTVTTNIVVFALGGGSWRITGSDGTWRGIFRKKGFKTKTFQPSNCAFKVNWETAIIDKFAGKPLKNISITCDKKSQKGEVVLSQFGLEGNAIYALSPEIRKQLKTGKASILIDFKPTFSIEVLLKKLTKTKAKHLTDCLRNELNLSALQIGLIKTYVSKYDFNNNSILAGKIKNFPIEIEGIAKIDEAISTIGGIDLKEITPDFKLTQQSNTYCIGEMLNWDAPTGGYLLQACFSMGYYLAEHLNKK
ncbi:NAD(P)-dependent oxidoreductase [Vicingaceae bacterium]|nr:NAD(P)-dependent oxidoreductase [Vicingaceae bacterium]MDB4062061.1 NAD(P)-dependent oxidoreductase [Vicingaceae bacterium]MDC0005003.1 NAD(P)-dependent oxidoreductase [bacterium]MDC1452360.1 NAD(P)-dependent oxidoreductase [Vicingaceae bacterium]